jgi:imidazolonepropionase-like amidohydrolase
MAVSDLGSIAPGKLADLVVLDADPLADVANLSRASYVLRDGRTWRPAKLMEPVRSTAAP